MSAINAFGVKFGNVLLPEVTRRLLNGQKYEFKFGFPQLNKTGDFNFDWALVRKPLIYNRVMDLEFFADIGPHQSSCTLPDD